MVPELARAGTLAFYLDVKPGGGVTRAAYRIRQATLEDAPVLARLRFEFRSTQNPVVESRSEFISRCETWMRERLLSGTPWRSWVAAVQDEVVGTLWLQTIEKIPNPGDEREFHGYVSSIYVTPESRRLGIATSLLRSCLKECDSLALDAVFLWCTPESRLLYERHGFRGNGELLTRKFSALTGVGGRS
jgi:ribosomal protein S18 acetylase RimI-like enzyme